MQQRMQCCKAMEVEVINPERRTDTKVVVEVAVAEDVARIHQSGPVTTVVEQAILKTTDIVILMVTMKVHVSG